MGAVTLPAMPVTLPAMSVTLPAGRGISDAR